ncbi:MAG: DUF4398 domain-containing protein [Pseudomonadota bacterium]
MKPVHLACAFSLLASACVTVPPPTDLLGAAERSVQRADASRGDDPSPAALKSARAKLAAARDAFERRDMLQATRMAEEARLDADFAALRMEASRAQFNVEAMKKSNEALRQQSLRNAVNVAPIAIPAAIPEPLPEAAEPTSDTEGTP